MSIFLCKELHIYAFNILMITNFMHIAPGFLEAGRKNNFSWQKYFSCKRIVMVIKSDVHVQAN